MSIARQLLREFRPLFQMFEEPFGRSTVGYGFPHHHSLLSDPFFGSVNALRPAVDVSEEGDKYVVEADLPGVKKENVEIIVGDGGRSITIQGKTPATRRGAPESQSQEASSGTAATEGASTVFRVSSLVANLILTSGTEAVTTTDQSQNQLTTERLWSGSSIFTRTVWLPRPVDRSKVKAKLEDGILTLQAPKAEDQETVKVSVE
ncbi:HSP20-like chaperone [Pisolithus thermaeus]|nr:HSP20-like chaperone [Pisolithus thermaeus]